MSWQLHQVLTPILQSMLIRFMNRELKSTLIRVCQGPECRDCGGPELRKLLLQRGIQAEKEHCQGLCAYAPIAHIDQRCISEATIKKIMSIIQRPGESEKQAATSS